ncbi:hypothetical protein M569_05150 [Genlisea aurea]|uniref:Cytochrome P450 n=1 Tax=Genlisea aurea TaxID=192259 RepID=S8EAP9_9LAMI|nr:hypothetical protein M569_05150 [Genlisea aurea]
MAVESLLFSVLLLGLITLVVKLLNWVWFRPKRLEKLLRKQGLHGNPYRFLLGDVRDMMNVTRDEQLRSIRFSDHLLPHILPFYHGVITKHGKNSFFWFGPRPRLNISDPEMLKEILAKPDVFHKTRPDPGETIAGGIAFLEDDEWAKRRKIITPAFHIEKLKNVVPVVWMSCLKMMENWEGKFSVGETNQAEIDVWPCLEELTADVISTTSFGVSSEEGRRVYALQQRQVKLVLDVLQFFFIPGWKFVPSKANTEMKSISREIGFLLRRMIEHREKAMRNGDAIDDDLLNALMESNLREIKDQGNEKRAGLSVEDVIEECKLFYFAGSETTSVLLVYTMVMLGKHQEWQARAREEVFRVLGKQQKPTTDCLSRLKIVTMILQEVLRLYPPAPVTLRTPTRSVKLGNMTVPKGVDLMLLIGEMHHDPMIWGADAGEFKPERFSEGISGAAKTRYSFIPFISGPRVCIGQNFAMITARLSLAMILQRFSVDLSPSYRHAPFPILTLQPQHGATLLLKKL